MAEQAPDPRKGMPDVQLDEGEFRRRFLSQFIDPAFAPLKGELDKVAGAAWDGYSNGRKSPRTRKAGPGFADPDYDLADRLARDASDAIDARASEHDDPAQPPCVLIVNGSSRSEHTCPGEMSKSWRLIADRRARSASATGVEVEILDLSRLARRVRRARSIRARRASRPRRRSATGRARAIRTIRSARRRTG